MSIKLDKEEKEKQERYLIAILKDYGHHQSLINFYSTKWKIEGYPDVTTWVTEQLYNNNW